MQKKSPQSAFFNVRVLIGLFVVLAGVFLVLLGFGTFSKASAQPNVQTAGAPTVVPMVGPVAQNKDLRSLPYVAPNSESEEQRLTRHPLTAQQGRPAQSQTSAFTQFSSLIKGLLRPLPNMPAPLLTFDGMNSVQSACGCLPPDSDGDVGPNHYVNAVNTRIKIFDKSGNPLNGVNGTTFNSFFSAIGAGNPCGANRNQGDPFVLYDSIADRWLVSDFAFPSFPGTSFWQCIGISQTPDPVAGGWYLYAVQVDPAHTNYLGDYPKFALWPDAYYLTMNLFQNNSTFNGVRVYALDRASMIAGGPTNAVGFTIGLAGVGDSYSLVPASFRTGDPPPAGSPEFLLAVDASIPGAVLTQVHGWLFHVDFAVPANSTLGVGVNHTPNSEITVDPFVQAWTAATYNLVPQMGSTRKLDTLGDKIMTPVAYQNRGGTASLWAAQTVMENFPAGPTAINWYQFDVTGGSFPATPAQQQSWDNGGDGLFRWMPSIAVDRNGNAAIGYSTSSASMFASIRYAGRLAGDPSNDLGQGEAIMTNGGGAQNSSSGRWGDYSMLTIDPADGLSFWHVNEYYAATANAAWFTRIGKFAFPTPPATSFVIGDLNAVLGNHVMFWGAQWANNNSLSGGPAPSSFKGFANLPNPNPPACGGTWQSGPGNSSKPPHSVPADITVIVSSSITQSHSTINGNVPEIVIVHTDPGYDGDPGHPGTGTVTGVICPYP